LLIRGYLDARLRFSRLVVVGGLPYGRLLKVLRPLLALWGISLCSGFLPDELPARYIAAVDVLLVVRRRSLNSSLPTLGLSLGKVVVGPSFGVSREILTSFENPAYDPQSHCSLALALDKRVKLASAGLGEKNRERALDEWRWEDIAEKLVDALEEIRRRSLSHNDGARSSLI